MGVDSQISMALSKGDNCILISYVHYLISGVTFALYNWHFQEDSCSYTEEAMLEFTVMCILRGIAI